MRNALLVLLFLLPSYVHGYDTLNEPAQLAKLKQEIARLQEAVPLKRVPEVVVFNPKIYGWYLSDTKSSCIYIVDRGKDQNIKTLRHEWEHARQHEAGEPYDEAKAYKAEDP